MLKRFAFALLVLLAFASPAAAGPFENGVAAYQRRDYATALRLWRPLAEQGHPRAQYNLGVMYNRGQGVRQDSVQAEAWFREAAARGNSDAQFDLGHMYDHGDGVPADPTLATYWYSKAADQGVAAAQLNLGVMYGKGRGVPQDHVQALMWLRLAAARESDPQRRAEIVKARDSVATQMTREQIAEAQRLAREWKPKGK